MTNLIGKKLLIEFEVIRRNDLDPNLYGLRTSDEGTNRQIWLYDTTIQKILDDQSEVEIGDTALVIVRR